MISEAKPALAFDYKLQSERSHRFLQQPKAPIDFKPTQAQIQSQLLAKLDRGATNMILFGGLFTTEIAKSHGCNSVPHSFEGSSGESVHSVDVGEYRSHFWVPY
jgi:hypothetical protein